MVERDEAVQHEHVEHVSAGRATLTLLVGIVAITAAGFVADVIAHLTVHAAFPDRAEWGRMLRVSGTAIASAGVPLILLALAAFGVFELEGALRAASIVYLVTLGSLLALGIGVILLQQLAHGH